MLTHWRLKKNHLNWCKISFCKIQHSFMIKSSPESECRGNMLTINCSVVPDSVHPMDRSLPGFVFHGIFQTRILEWVSISSCSLEFYQKFNFIALSMKDQWKRNSKHMYELEDKQYLGMLYFIICLLGWLSSDLINLLEHLFGKIVTTIDSHLNYLEIAPGVIIIHTLCYQCLHIGWLNTINTMKMHTG